VKAGIDTVDEKFSHFFPNPDFSGMIKEVFKNAKS
jgi:hypothetical protein